MFSLWCQAPGVFVVLRRSQGGTPQRDARTAVRLRQKSCVTVAKSGCVLRASELFGGLQAVWWSAGLFDVLQGCLVFCMAV